MFFLKNSLRSRLNLFLITALPTFLLTVRPSLRTPPELRDLSSEIALKLPDLESWTALLQRRTVKLAVCSRTPCL